MWVEPTAHAGALEAIAGAADADHRVAKRTNAKQHSLRARFL
jgi:hypothetical protein